MISIVEREGYFEIAGAPTSYFLRQVKAMPGKRWDPINKLWVVPKSSTGYVRTFSQRMNITITGMDTSPEVVGEIAPLPELETTIDLKRNLFPYQSKGVAYSIRNKRLIVGDEPGLGKTGQAIATLEAAKQMGGDCFPALIICPSSLKLNWQKEINLWTKRTGIILNDAIKNNFIKYYDAGYGDYFIVNYESLKKYFVESIDTPKGKPLKLENVKFKAVINQIKSVIIDESHRCKSFLTQQSKFAKGISNGKEWILALTGTPVVNKPLDLAPQLAIINRLADFGGYKKFLERYCAGSKQASNLKELNFKLKKHCFYRREKKEVLTDLPAKMRQIVSCEISTRHEYNVAMNDLEKYLSEYKKATDAQVQKSMRGEIMVRIGILKNISARGKLKDVVEYISDVIDSGEKFGIFAHQHQVVDELLKNFPDALCITGRQNMQEREEAVEEFQYNKDAKLIILGIEAAGVGLTLTAGSRCGFIELGWNPAKHDQCEDRFHRIGQKDSVSCAYFLGKDTIDEDIYKLIDEKRAMVNAITGAEDEVEVNMIDNIINLFNQKK